MENNIDPDQTFPRSSLVRVYSGKIYPEVHLNICSRLISRHPIQDKILAYLGLSLISCSKSN